MKLDLLSGACGAEINGINLKDISSSNIKIIKNLLFFNIWPFVKSYYFIKNKKKCIIVKDT